MKYDYDEQIKRNEIMLVKDIIYFLYIRSMFDNL